VCVGGGLRVRIYAYLNVLAILNSKSRVKTLAGMSDNRRCSIRRVYFFSEFTSNSVELEWDNRAGYSVHLRVRVVYVCVRIVLF